MSVLNEDPLKGSSTNFNQALEYQVLELICVNFTFQCNPPREQQEKSSEDQSIEEGSKPSV